MKEIVLCWKGNRLNQLCAAFSLDWRFIAIKVKMLCPRGRIAQR